MRCMVKLIAFILCAAITTTASAVDYAEHVTGAGAIQIDPSKAYIAFRLLQKSEFRFLRVPTDQERADYGKERAAAYIQARVRKPGLKESDFEFPTIEDRFAVNSEFGKVLEKQNGLLVYLIVVKPGKYVLYGHMWRDGPGDVDTCFCMGTVMFDAPAGQVTDLGRIRMTDDWDMPPPALNPAGIPSFALLAVSAPARETGRLQGLPVRAAELRAAGKMPNTFGVAIDRLAPIPGTLEYDKDRVIDPKDRSVKP